MYLANFIVPGTEANVHCKLWLKFMYLSIVWLFHEDYVHINTRQAFFPHLLPVPETEPDSLQELKDYLLSDYIKIDPRAAQQT